MIFSVSSRQTDEVLSLAQEIRIDFRDFAAIYHFVEKYPNAKFAVLLNHNISEEQWQELLAICGKFPDQFIIGLGATTLVHLVKDKSLPWYLNQVTTTWREFQSLKKAGAKQILIGGQLLFCKTTLLKEKGDCLLRFIPNISNYDPSFPYENGIVGPWIRPDDIDLYQEFLDICQFKISSLSGEKTLLSLYSKEKTWHGDLSKLITDLGVSCNNRGLPEDFGSRRSNCGQRCCAGSSCNICFNAFIFAEEIKKLKHNQESIDFLIEK